MTWDIFCTVIDNYGDIGVTWRLARQLAAEHGVKVRLWVDDLEAFRHIRPEVDPNLEVQALGIHPVAGDFPLCTRGHEGTLSLPPLAGGTEVGQSEGLVEIRHWRKPLPEVEPGEVVIEALACNLPEEFVVPMADRHPAPVWLNLEYLTAEDWARQIHGLPSPHPRLPLTKYFFMPGYTADTGGLVREAWLAEARDRFQADAAGRSTFWQSLGLPAAIPGELRLSLFSYDNPALAGLLDAWRDGDVPIRALVPQGKALPDIARWFGLDGMPSPGALLARGALSLHVLPMLDQDGYDRLLWACDLNFVRGEDSFVRAQWAGRPLVWQAYRQAEDAHLAKLKAFLDLYCQGMPDDLAQLTRNVWYAWNQEARSQITGQPESDFGHLWPTWQSALITLGDHGLRWRKFLENQPDQTANLMIFCKKKLE